jgi:hypothetical protein
MKKRRPITEYRVCASCEWIFRDVLTGCPKCDFVTYSAHYVYGKRAYRYVKTQEPYFKKKVSDFACKLLNEIEKTNPLGENNAKRKRLPFNP